MRPFSLAILEADSPFYEGPCISLTVPAIDGSFGVLAGHTNTILAIVPGELTFTPPEGPKRIAAVSSGIMIIEGGKVLVLVSSAEKPEEIDLNRAAAAAHEAQEALLHKQSRQEYKLTQANLARATSRIRVKEHFKEN
ncbi:MAG: ATP synthase F1 subunit epsilon [Oscillospiraceae bacterium]|jgi:F-type H+-transporting ATPase subunit epsilon|nr:ATP synthase F1 subunit epsilon [Oscillospiraceae bacterium]